ncbi:MULTISPECIES: SPOR domain-containing protein [Alteromonadaceae]|uniref:SPOR domain-containing protein n=1 Tax=Brumicola blandensis TaxID=3075611 RepID=A0AAW8R1V9_9ALTE|nr:MULTISPECIES: SPOR domain-containing protein [unclassified Alteromonas]MDT0581143.1 SPOR domain-containing protein [Alteromonas sp. W409]MDT0626761.1 SPOR domain-containing protein [Alteromonas sp. W364]
MSNALQNRLVGTIILVAVTVIFLPDYLDGKKQTNNETFVDFPRSTSNLSATEPETFPAEQVANATRREVVIVDDVAADDLLEKADETSDGNTANAQTADNASEKSDEQANELAKTLAKNMQAAANEASNEQKGQASAETDNKNVTADEGKPSTPNQDNSLATQTLQKDTSAEKLKDQGWVVQLGSFGNLKNVNDLIRKLEKAGYRVFTRKVQTSAGRLTKVFVGPEIERDKLDKALPHLKATTGLTGKVTPFDVNAN